MADQVIIGVDPHKMSATIEASDSREILRATGRFGTDAGGYRRCGSMPGSGRSGYGRWRAQRCRAPAGAAAARDGERVVDVPAKLAARARVFDTGHDRKTDACRRPRDRDGRGAH